MNSGQGAKDVAQNITSGIKTNKSSKTVKDLSDEMNKINAEKPITGTRPDSATSIYNPSGNYVGGGNPTSENAVTNLTNTTDTKYRVGDWIYQGRGQWAPVTGSNTYVRLNSNVVHGGYKNMQGLNFSDFTNAVGAGAQTGLFAAANGAGPLGAAVGVGAFLSSLFDAEQRHRDDFLNQEIDYESAVTFHTDKDGREYYTIDYDKLADAGIGSGAIIKSAIDTTNTKAMLTGDNTLSVNVSPTFAASERYSELLEQLQDIFSNGLTLDQANEVVDEESGKTRLDMIEQTIKQEELNFYYSAQTFHDMKKIAPNASDESLKEAAATQLIGGLDKKALANAEVVIYDENNNKQTVNAKSYLDSIKDMNEEQRNNYMASLGNRIQSSEISDDEKVVLQAQANALYSASKNDGEYHDMYMKDFWDEVADARTLLFGIRVGDVLPFLGPEELTTFERNEIIGPLFDTSTTIARALILGKVTNGIESIMRTGVAAAGSKMSGPLGEFLSGINEFAKQDAANPFPIQSALGKGLTGAQRAATVGKWAGVGATQMAFMLGADLAYETGKAAAHGLAGEDFNFWDEFGQDVAMDALMTYGPRNYLSAVNLPRYEWRRYDGDVTQKYKSDEEFIKKADEIYENNIKDIAEDEFDTGDLYPTGTGIREYAGLVEVTADELAIRHAKRLDKLTNSSAMVKVQELFGDKNAAMAKLAIQVRAAGGSVKDYREALRFANDIKKVTEDTYMQFKQFGNVSNDFKAMSDIINKVLPNKKDFSKDEINYINAAANRYRFLAENKGDKEAEAYIRKFYDGYINKIDPERAQELDELANAMRKVVANVLDFNKFKGLLSDADIKKLRNSPAYKNGMFLPVWSKGAGVNGKWANEIGQGRAGRKKVFNKDELISVEDLEHPLVSVSQYINNNMRNIAINDRALAIRDAANIPGVGIHVYSDTGGSLSEISNLKELSDEFGKRYENIVKKVKKEYPSHQQWLKINSDLVMNSEALAKTEQLKNLQKEGDSLKRKRRKLEKAQEEALNNTVGESYTDEAGVKVKEVKIDGNFIPVDVEIADRIGALNSIGYETLNSHSGIGADHKNKGDAGGGYIQFKADNMSPDLRMALTNAANKAGMYVVEQNNIAYGPVLVVYQDKYKNGSTFQEVVKQANKNTIEHFGLPAESLDAEYGSDWISLLTEQGKFREGLAYRDAEEKRLQKEAGGYVLRTDPQRKKSWNTFFEELGIAKAPVNVDEVKAEYDKLAKESRELSEKAAAEGMSEEESAKMYEQWKEKQAEKDKAWRKLNNAIASGNIQAKLLPKVDDLDTILVKDPKVDAGIKKLRRRFNSVDDAIEWYGISVDKRGWQIDDDMEGALSKVIYDSYMNGARSTAGDPDQVSFTDVMDIEDAVLPLAKLWKDSPEEFLEKANKAYADSIKKALSDDEMTRLLKILNNRRAERRKELASRRNEIIKWFDEAKPLIRKLGIESYSQVYENGDALIDAYGDWSSRGVQKITNSETGAEEWVMNPTETAWFRGNPTRRYSTDEATLRVALGGLSSSLDAQSVFAHEAAHDAYSRAQYRVPILTDVLRSLGIKKDVSEAIAASRDATELIAYMTQKRFLAEMNGQDSPLFKHDSVVNAHIETIKKNLGDQTPVNFKQRLIDLIKISFNFLKEKILHPRSLRSVKTFDDFYRGLINGDFKDEMRISTVNQRYTPGREMLVQNYDTAKSPDGRNAEMSRDLDLNWNMIDVAALKMAEDIQDIKNKIEANGAEQARVTDEIKESARKMLEEAKKLSKGAPVEFDVNTFVNVELTNALKKAFKSNAASGQIHNVLNEAITLANPYVNRNTVIQTRAAEAAEKYRKRVAKHMAYKRNVEKGKKLSAEHINELADKAMDKISEKVIGKRNQVSAINDAELTRILNSGGDGHTIRYMLDGKEHRLVLTGKGSEELVKEFYAPEFTIKGPFKQKLLNAANKVANAKRYLTTSADVSRVLPNLARDWSRGIVTTGGLVLLSPDDLRTDALEYWKDDEKAMEKINNGFNLASAAVEGDTFTQSMLTAKKNRPKSMVKAMRSEDGNAFTRFMAKTTGEKLSMLQDMGEEFTRKRAMTNAYYQTLADASAKGVKIDDAVKQAVEAAYFYGREATTNFSRRGKLISQIAQMVPYLTQNFSSLESFKYAYLDNPIAVGRSLKATVTAYSAMIAIALSNEESRKRYFLLTEYDRANNIIIPLTNGMIMTIPLDENIAAFLTPYRRMIETLNGVDPEAFYLWGAEFLEALSPFDLTGFSEGDKFNVVRGFQKLGSQLVPTWAMPFLEAATGTDWYRGTDISVDEEYVGARTGNYTPSAGELTTKSANSKLLASVADGTGIPQWILQRFVSEYGGNVGQYMLNTLDKLAGATADEQGGKEWKDSIFRPFTGADSDAAANAFWSGVNIIEDKKKRLQNELRTIKNDIDSSTGEEKAELEKKRQEKIAKYGTDVSDFVSQYLNAYEITGGLTKSQANRIWHLYAIYDQDNNQNLYAEGSVEEYFADKAQKSANKKGTNLAANSGFDQLYHSNDLTDYDTSYAMSALKNTIYGVPTQQMVDLANILEDTTDYANSYTKLRSDVKAARQKLYEQKRWDERDKLAYQYDYKILAAIYPYLLEHGVAETLNRTAVMDYLADWIIVPTSEQKTAKGRYVPSLGVDSQKEKAFKKQFIKKMFGVAGE